MKVIKYLSITQLIVYLLLNFIIANNDSASAQSPAYNNLTLDIQQKLETDIDKTIELTYRSVKITDQQKAIKVFLEVTLRKLSGGFGYNYSQTPLIKVMIEQNNNLRVVTRNFGLETNHYNFDLFPLAFSPNNRYLLIAGGAMATDYTFHKIVDLGNNDTTINMNLCPIETYEGFVSNIEIVFSCSDFGMGEDFIAILNLQDKTVTKKRKGSLKQINLLPRSYIFTDQPKVIKIQKF
ncbi:hypothetical protein PCC8801_0788 [Rippkaea orientalis PCC 8801]|uniref:Uncharacterized protein n=1 Tax=Rippkaea orientalis (strain PCC 8801 / RF-1) TaxID=41431 RepID=B7JYK0_RIPO1|nr:hypothetical protein [Rippkaea orientalis]ACK64870.1 hypothetical protein PCC8801_0788 [Rippkaea orientalis PCC 8801]